MSTVDPDETSVHTEHPAERTNTPSAFLDDYEVTMGGKIVKKGSAEPEVL